MCDGLYLFAHIMARRTLYDYMACLLVYFLSNTHVFCRRKMTLALKLQKPEGFESRKKPGIFSLFFWNVRVKSSKQ